MMTKIIMKSDSVFHIEQKTEFEKLNDFFKKILRSSFGRIKVTSTWLEESIHKG